MSRIDQSVGKVRYKASTERDRESRRENISDPLETAVTKAQ